MFFMVVTTATDLDRKIIPDEATFGLLATGLLTSPWNPIFAARGDQFPLVQGLIGALTGGGVLLLISIFGQFLMKTEVMGGGDIKLLAGVGAFLGWDGALFTLFLASLSGGFFSVVGIILKRLRRKQQIPFGPFLNFGAIFTFFLMISSRDFVLEFFQLFG